MTHKTIRIALALIIVATISIAALASANDPQVSLKSLSVKEVSLSGGTADLTVYLEVQNPGSSFTLKDVTYKLKLNGEQAAEGKQKKDIDIPARSTVTVEMPLTVNLVALPAITWTTMTGGFKLHYDLETEFGVPVLGLFTHKVKTAFNGDFTIGDAFSSAGSLFKGIFGVKP
ncbi:MAG TPA: LEA type 2 family protein [Pyrinomonadaceae bacterium]|nr:LEA type 2 family protein [Pyrinomonadaceae bacterium]